MNGRTLPALAAAVGAVVVPSLWAIESPTQRAGLSLVALVVVFGLGYFYDRKKP